MTDKKQYLLRKVTGDVPAETEQEVRDLFQKGQCKPADFLFDFSTGQWTRVGDMLAFADLIGAKPPKAPEKKLVYYMTPGNTPFPQGPFSTKELQQRMQTREVCESSWVFVDGDKEWRQVREVKVLLDMLPPLPTDKPAAATPPQAPAAAAPKAPAAPSAPPKAPAAPKPSVQEEDGSISLDLGDSSMSIELKEDAPPSDLPTDAEEHVEHEEATMALSTLGLSLQVDHSTTPDATSAPAPEAPPAAPAKAPAPSAPPAAPAKPPGIPPVAASVPPSAPPAAAPPPKPPGPPPMGAAPGLPPKAPPKPAMPSAAPPAAPPVAVSANSGPPPAPGSEDAEGFDGITAQISTEPIWQVKQATSEAVSGPFRFLEIMKFLEQGRLNKNDKVSKVGTNRFVKIAQQYEFNVKYAVETVIEHGVEQQRILIKRRHPRVPYFTEVQVTGKQSMLTGSCVNISAGGILMEISRADFNLGDILEVKLLPGIIPRAISCKSLVIGKIPKMPPAFALKFEDLKAEDKEAIEFYVQEMLKREK